jgi:uncharacterized phage protein gp47/JayE
MALEPSSVAEIEQALLDEVTTRRSTWSTHQLSDLGIEAHALALQLHRQQVRDEELLRTTSPRWALDDALDRFLDQWLEPGNGRKAASAWIGKLRFRKLSGTPTIASGQRGTFTSDGTIYETTEGSSTWSGDYMILAARSVTLGSVANKSFGTTLAVQSPPTGVSAECTIYDDGSAITLGANKEGNEAARLRLLNSTRYRPASGNWAHCREWAMTVAGVSDCFIYPKFYGRGTVLIVPVGPASARALAAGTILAVQAKIEGSGSTAGARPALARCYYKAITDHPVTVAVEVAYGRNFGPDFDDATPAVLTDAGCTASVIKCDVDPTQVEADDRIVIPIGASSETQQREVLSVNHGAKEITVKTAFSAAPAPNMSIKSGGPLWQPVRDAIAAAFTEKGPARVSTATYSRYPEWQDESPSKLYVSDIKGKIELVPGAIGVNVSAPTTDHDLTVAIGAADIELLTLAPNVAITFVSV